MKHYAALLLCLALTSCRYDQATQTFTADPTPIVTVTATPAPEASPAPSPSPGAPCTWQCPAYLFETFTNCSVGANVGPQPDNGWQVIWCICTEAIYKGGSSHPIMVMPVQANCI